MPEQQLDVTFKQRLRADIAKQCYAAGIPFESVFTDGNYEGIPQEQPYATGMERGLKRVIRTFGVMCLAGGTAMMFAASAHHNTSTGETSTAAATQVARSGDSTIIEAVLKNRTYLMQLGQCATYLNQEANVQDAKANQTMNEADRSAYAYTTHIYRNAAKLASAAGLNCAPLSSDITANVPVGDQVYRVATTAVTPDVVTVSFTK